MSPAPEDPRRDAAHMWRALELAGARLGSTWPNPSVGCLVTRGAQVLGEAATAPGGRPHGEPQALATAGEAAAGASVHVSLEPCSHWGQSPPCVDALVQARVSRVVVATGDPDPRVSGRGLARLAAAGIDVVQGPFGAEAELLNRGFFRRVLTGRPLLALRRSSLHGSFDARLLARSGAGTGGWPDLRGSTRGGPGVPIELPLDPDADLAVAILALGEAGLTRVVVDPRDPLAAPLVEAGLVELPGGLAAQLVRDPLLLATHNAGKLREFATLLGPETRTRDAAELGLEAPIEDRDSYLDNARLKADRAAAESGMPCLADDGGLEIAMLDDAPGIHTARFADECGGWPAALERIADRCGLREPGVAVPARARCALALATPDAPTCAVEASVEGLLRWPPRPAHPGFAAIFEPMAGPAFVEGKVLRHRRLAFALLNEQLGRLSP